MGERKIATFPRPYKMRSGRILQMMNALGAIDTKGNIVLEQFRDNMIASGNDDLDARVTILKENGNFKNVDTAIPVTSLEELEQYRSDRLTDKVTSLKDSLDAQYKADERGRVFDRPCQVLDDGDLDEH